MIPFTQFMMPDGRRADVTIQRQPEIELMAHRIIAAGYTFEIEMLSDYATVSVEIINNKERVIGSDICPNGPPVPIMIDRLIQNAFSKIPKKFQKMKINLPKEPVMATPGEHLDCEF